MDCITKEEALEMLRKNVPFKKERIEKIKLEGYPAYTTAVSLIWMYLLYKLDISVLYMKTCTNTICDWKVGWLGYSDEKIVNLCNKFIDLGFNAFKMKVGKDLEDDKRRLRYFIRFQLIKLIYSLYFCSSQFIRFLIHKKSS